MRGHIRRRGDRWAVVVDVGRGENGRRRQRWHSGFDTKREASKALTEILGRLQGGSYIEPSRATLGTFLQEWIEAQKVKVRPSTWRSYAMNIEVHIIPRLGELPLQQITPAALNSTYADLLASGRINGGGGLSPRTVRYCHTILRKALADAVKWNRLVRNVADQADPPSPKATHSREMRTWAADELRAFLGQVKDDRLYAAWVLAATTGLRRGEVLGLRWSDVDLEKGRIAVTQTLLAVRGELSISEPKTAKGRRSVALDETTAAALHVHRAAQLVERMALGLGGPASDGLVFTTIEGGPVHPDHFSRGFEKHVRKAGLPCIRLHDLRHTHATLALSAGVHPKVVSERLGHATVSITLDTYSHAIPAMQEEAAEKVAALVFGT